MDNTITSVVIFIAIINVVFGLVILVRWWKMTADIKDIRNHLLNRDVVKPHVGKVDIVKAESDEELEMIEGMKKKLKANDCIVKVKQTGKLEIWDDETWNDHVKAGKMQFFELKYKS